MRIFFSVAVAITMIGAMTMPREAAASATGCDNRQHFEGSGGQPNAVSEDIKFPYGYLCHLIHSDGKEISQQKAAYTLRAGIYAPLVQKVCNWRIDFVYFDTKGKEYMRDKGEVMKDCEKGASRNIAALKKLSEYGSTCAELIVDGEVRLRQCHTITE